MIYLAWWAAVNTVLAVVTVVLTDPLVGLRRLRRR